MLFPSWLPDSGAAGIATVAALWIALAVDRWLGEPPARWHPVVWIGNYLGAMGRRIAPAASTPSDGAMPPHGLPRALPFIAGASAWIVGAAISTGVAIAVQRGAWSLPLWAAALLLGLLLKPLLAWHMLRDEVRAVESALGESLEAGRAQLARLVSRDVSALTEAEVRESAIESLAENLNDSVVAPLFWFVLLGLPGAALYRFANTADAMWGYIGPRNGRDWTWAGKWAAYADDVLSWVPARLTAVLLVCASAASADLAASANLAGSAIGRKMQWKTLRREARRTPSPNSGWPMAAMALRLGIRLGKPGVYVLNASGRTPLADDVGLAARHGARAVAALGIGATLLVAMAIAALAGLRLTSFF